MHSGRSPERIGGEREGVRLANVRRAPAPGTPVQRMLFLQRAAGNTAVTQALGGARERAGDSAEEQAGGQSGDRSAVAAAKAGLTRSLVGHNVQIPLVTAHFVKGRLDDRINDGPLFSQQELGWIEALSGEPGWLHRRHLCTIAEADAYIAADDHRAWIKRPTGQRLVIASRYWHNPPASATGRTPTRPEHHIARFLATRRAASPQRRLLEQERDDQIRDTFLDTFVAPGLKDSHSNAEEHRRRDKHANEMLTRIFVILQHGLKVYEPGEGHVDYREGDVARALAHGGRVNIRIPKITAGENPYALTNHLGATRGDRGEAVAPTQKRSFATHHMGIGWDDGPRSGRFKEKSGLAYSLQNKFADPRTKLYGADPAAGGLGNLDFNGETILPDGSNGHIFLGLKLPTIHRPGALQVGIETTAPGKTSGVGYKHTWRSSEKKSSPVSSFHGHKQDKIGGGKTGDNQRFVDLDEFRSPEHPDWLGFLQHLQEEWEAKLNAARDDAQRRTVYAELIGRRRLADQEDQS